jgi:dTDP-4-dehydrorhamnose reductase|tara:strand:- start:189 stop:1067 length:879 start_codon:yes stop_codon:yes gene_type:complete
LKILVIGGSSILGYKLLQFFIKKKINVEYTFYKTKIPVKNGHVLDIRNEDDTIKTINKIKPTHVILVAALTNLDLCESDHDLADSVNIKSTENVITACKKAKSSLIYVSTSFVFNGEKTEYYEDDPIKPSTYYGKTKGESEELVRKSGLKFLILRTDALYDWIEKWQRDNSVTRALKSLRAGKILREVNDWYNTPTYVKDFVLATFKLIENNKEGIYHLSGSEYINRYNWSLNVADVFKLMKNTESINSNELNLSAKRVNINLKNNKLYNDVGILMKNTTEGLKDMLNVEKK